ncbi:MAG: translation initiation factor IF-2 N-terminal domain-containing protein, partial [Nakamurella sp.]
MTSTLESALAGLPAKPRVHELSKRIGISNKELIAALAERGLEIKSASASVPLAVAQEVIEALLGPAADGEQVAPESGAPADEQAADAVQPAVDDAAIGDEPPAAAAIPGDTPGDTGHAITPLFLPPAEFEPQPPSGIDEQGQGAPD